MEGTMKQLVLSQKGGPWVMVEKPIPQLQRDEVLVKITSTSICNQTDLNSIKALHPPHEVQNHGGLPHHLRIWDNRLEGDPLAKYYNYDMPDLKPYPAPMGHEAMGVVVEVGELDKVPASRAVKVGDRVCVLCDSTLSQYAVCPANVNKVPDGLTDDEGGLWEPWMVAWGPCSNTVKFGISPAVCDVAMTLRGEYEEDLDAKTIKLMWVLKNEATEEDAMEYAVEMVQQFNNIMAIQKDGYALSTFDTFGGIWDAFDLTVQVSKEDGTIMIDKTYAAGTEIDLELPVYEGEGMNGPQAATEAPISPADKLNNK